jgi:hypothetical protein
MSTIGVSAGGDVINDLDFLSRSSCAWLTAESQTRMMTIGMVKTIMFLTHQTPACIFHPPSPSIASQSFALDTPLREQGGSKLAAFRSLRGDRRLRMQAGKDARQRDGGWGGENIIVFTIP